MKVKYRDQLSENLRLNPSEIHSALSELEVYYVVRECLNRADLGRVGDFGSNGMRTGATEYDSETEVIFRYLIDTHDSRRELSKEEILSKTDEVFRHAFSETYPRPKLTAVANAIYNELHKLCIEIRGRRFKITNEHGFQNNIQ